jgi:hypothetical protein
MVEALRILEEKTLQLIEKTKRDAETIQQLRDELQMFQEENKRLSDELDKVQEALLVQDRNSKKLDEGLEVTAVAVRELIQNIDGVLKDSAPV